MKSYVSHKHAVIVQLLMFFTGMLVLLTMLTSPRLMVQVEINKTEENTSGVVIHFEEPVYNKMIMRLRNPYKTLSMQEALYAKKVFDERKNRLDMFCKLMDFKKPLVQDIILPNMVIDPMHAISWCPVYKAASSTWMRHFAVLGGVLSDDINDLIKRNLLQLNTVVRQVFPRDYDVNKTYEKLNKTKKFFIVRHPHERLLSAYRDKIEHIAGREYYYKRFGRRIVQKYRRIEDRNSTKLEPTFTEFLRYIVTEKYFDEHWAPFYSTCKPCTINYDYILHFETLHIDEPFVIQELGLHDYLDQTEDMRNNNPNGITDRLIVQNYLKDVPPFLLKKINKIYEKDFTLFLYSPKEYLSDQHNFKNKD